MDLPEGAVDSVLIVDVGKSWREDEHDEVLHEETKSSISEEKSLLLLMIQSVSKSKEEVGECNVVVHAAADFVTSA